MKHFLIFWVVMLLIVVVGTFAQTQETSEKTEVNPIAAKPTATPHPEVTKTPRVYPIAPGVWYPGQPLPKKAFRYYRMRCWPGCHSYGEFANPPKTKKPDQTSY